jgi:N-acetylglutamate synthase-like GNAT family acetyltransferase
MKIRKAKMGDVPGCLEIQKLWKDNFNSESDFKSSVKDMDAFFLVAVEENEVVGFITGSRNLVKRSEAYLQQTMVNPNLKRKGIGKKLVDAFCKFVKKEGVLEIYAELEKEHVPFYIGSCKFKDRGNHVLVVKELK